MGIEKVEARKVEEEKCDVSLAHTRSKEMTDEWIIHV